MLKSGAARGRPRTFDEDAAVEAALELFWRQGYRGTTTRSLETALEMSQPSIYNAFGSKRDLLLRAMDLYEKRVENELFSTLTATDDGYEAIGRFMAELSSWIYDSQARGCLMVNMMAGDLDDDTITERVERYRSKIRDAFSAAISRSESEAALISARADLLLAAVLGLHITARTAGSSDVVGTMAASIGRQVSEWHREQHRGDQQ